MQPGYDPRFDVDEPGHPNPIPVIIGFLPADDIVPNRPATAMRIHGTRDELVTVVLALFSAGIRPLCQPQVRACEPRHGCLHLYSLFDGHLTGIDISAAVLAVAAPGTLPRPLPPPFDLG
jgi:hypothetical protein